MTAARRPALFPATAARYYPEGKPLAEGALLRQPDLARTLRAIAKQGRAGFYDGWVADAILAGDPAAAASPPSPVPSRLVSAP